MSGSINFSGLGSGIDTESLIQQLLAVDRRPIQLIQNDVARLQQRQAAFQTVSAQLLGLQSAANTINGVRSFELISAGSSDTSVATVSATEGAQVGSHTVVVSNLAAAQKISSAAQTSQTEPLGFAGQIVVNGKAINVSASDSLASLASNINSAQTGVTASIISPSANQFYLTIASTNTGTQGQISLSDTAGGDFLGTRLGLFSTDGATSIRHTVSDTVIGSDLFSDSATSVATLQGQTAPASGKVQLTIGKVTRTVDINLTDKLSTIASNINAAFGKSYATVATVTDPISGASRQQLQLSGVSGPGQLVDDNNVLANLGLVQRNYDTGRELSAATDAHFTLDGLAATRSTNSFSDAISGVTINLVKAGTATVNISQDFSSIKSNIAAFVQAFNDTVDTVGAYSQFDASTGRTGPLFGDLTASSIVDSLLGNASSAVSGLPTDLSALSQAGITLDKGGHLVINDSDLSKALSSNTKGVAKLFRATGLSSDPNIQFVSSNEHTQLSGAGGFQVVVTQPATQASITADTAQTGVLALDETLTFSGTLFGSNRTLSLRAGASLDDIVSQINGDTSIGPQISASNDHGKLKLTATQYGSTGSFSVISAVVDDHTGTTSGLGSTKKDAVGLDVAGTINGEVARGLGQILTGTQEAVGTVPAGKALGLKLRITATNPIAGGANAPNVIFTSGIADITRNFVTSQTDAFGGALSTTFNSLQTNIDDLNKNIDDFNGRLKTEEDTLRLRFTAMEVAVARIKSGSAGLSSLAQLNNSK